MNSRLFNFSKNFSKNFQNKVGFKNHFNSLNVKNFSVLSNRKAEASVNKSNN
jgi:hypothetical protein